jgi:hypothetical protein
LSDEPEILMSTKVSSPFQFMGRRGLRSPRDVEGNGPMRVTAKAFHFEISVTHIERAAQRRRHLKGANNSVPVIYITGNDSPAVRRAAHQSGCLAYLRKPFSAKSLMEPLHRAATGLA